MDNKILLGAGFVKALGKSWPVNTRAFPLSIMQYPKTLKLNKIAPTFHHHNTDKRDVNRKRNPRTETVFATRAVQGLTIYRMIRC